LTQEWLQGEQALLDLGRQVARKVGVHGTRS
jgi:hypothetical protein